MLNQKTLSLPKWGGGTQRLRSASSLNVYPVPHCMMQSPDQKEPDQRVAESSSSPKIDAQKRFQGRMVELSMSATWAITAATRMQGKEIDRLRLHDAVSRNLVRFAELVTEEMSGTEENPGVTQSSWESAIRAIAMDAGIEEVELYERPDPARLPALVWVHGEGWGVIRGLNGQNCWVIDVGGQAAQVNAGQPMPCLRLVMQNFALSDSENRYFDSSLINLNPKRRP